MHCNVITLSHSELIDQLLFTQDAMVYVIRIHVQCRHVNHIKDRITNFFLITDSPTNLMDIHMQHH